VNTNLQKEAVVLFRNNSVHTTINSFLNQKQKKSKNTSKNYRLWIEEFFQAILGKSDFSMTWHEIENINYQDMCSFQDYLLAKGNSNNTVNQKIAGISSLWGEFKKHNININSAITKINPLLIKECNWGSLTEKEINDLLSYCEERSFKPFIQKIFFKTCFITGIRSNVILLMKKENIQHKIDKKTNKMIWCLCVKDKGKYITKAIPDSLYHELVQCMTPDTTRILNVCDKILRQTLKDYCKKQGIQNDRKIVLHSLKKTSMDYVWDMTKDIVKTAKQGQHTGVEMAYRNYLGQNSSLTEQASYDLFDKTFDISQLEHLTKKQLLTLIDNSDKAILRQLIYSLNSKGA